jgi:hypothetical protein
MSARRRRGGRRRRIKRRRRRRKWRRNCDTSRSPSIVRIVKFKTVRWAGYVASVDMNDTK